MVEHRQGNGSRGGHEGEFDPSLLHGDPASLLVYLIGAQMPEARVRMWETNNQVVYFIVQNILFFLACRLLLCFFT